MEILIEVIGEVLEALFGFAFESRRIPRGVKTGIGSILLVPFIILCMVLVVKFLISHELTGILLVGFCLALLIFLYVRMLLKIWKR